MTSALLLAFLLLAPAGSGAAPRPLRIVQVSDTHIGRHPPGEDAERLRTFLRQLVAQESPVDVWAFTGDLTHGALDGQFERFREALDVLPAEARVLLVRGNHDEERPPQDPGELFARVLGEAVTRVDLGGWRLVTAPMLTPDGAEGARLMEILRESELPTLLFVHYY
ncbi:MAG: metallophosphoesterase, partial [Deltaproteobacteria bacterium]|nr:metallophosphoesterase [Deltaproteobacteria bacterium]